MTRSDWTSLLLLLGLLGFPLLQAQAQNRKIIDQEIRSLYRQGKRLVSKRSYVRALIKFKAALALVEEQSKRKGQSPQEQQKLRKRKSGFLYVLARTYQYNKQLPQAYLAYQQSLASGAMGKIALRAKARMKLLRPKVLVPFSLQTTPDKAEFLLTDALQQKQSGTTPFTTRLPPGTYQLTLKLQGYQSQSMELKVPVEVGLTKSLTLKRLLASIEIRSTPQGAQVLLQSTDKSWSGKAPFVRQLPPGEYALQVSLEGHNPHKATLKLKLGVRIQQNIRLVPLPAKRAVRRVVPRRVVKVPKRPLPPLPHTRRTTAQIIGWTCLGLALAAGGGIGALLLVAEDDMKLFNANVGNPQSTKKPDEIYGFYSRATTLRQLGLYVGIGAGVLAATGVALLIWNGGPAPSRRPPAPAPKKANSRLILW